jgi:peroxiredoxin
MLRPVHGTAGQFRTTQDKKYREGEKPVYLPSVLSSQRGRSRTGSGFILSTTVLGLALLLSVVSPAQDDAPVSASDVPPILKIGAPAPDFDLPGVDAKRHSLKDYASSKVLVVIFNCDHCPVASMCEKRIKQLTSDYSNRGVSVVVIMGNDPKAIHLSEKGHTDLGDSLPEMKLRAAYRHFNYPYLYDGDTQAVALKYGPTATPHAFIFDQERILRYEGRIDNNAREELATRHEVRDAIDALLAGRPVNVQDTPAVGCSTKWAYKEAGAAAETAGDDQKPGSVEMVTADQLTTLRKNAGTDKLLLVNFWATWCGPCTEEFPELQKMVRMYAKRQLQIVTVSINSPDEKKFVIAFLQEQRAINRNLLFSGDDSADAVKAFGTDWKGGVPYTVLIGMNGEVLYKTQGGMNALDVRRVILKNLPDDRYIGQHAYWNSVF